MRLRTRFALYFTAMAFAVLGAASLFFYYSQKAEILGQVRIRHRQALASLVKVAEEAILTREDIALLNYLGELAARRGVAAAALVGLDGHYLAHPDPDLIGEEAEASPGPFAYAGLVSVQGRAVGEARLAFQAGLIEREVGEAVSSSMRRFLRSVVLGSLLLGMLVGLLAADGLTRPVRLLAEGARRIGEGRLEHRIPLERGDELGLLASEFNQMAQRLGELDRMKEEFLHSVTHDLRSPLQSAMGYADLMLKHRERLDESQARSLGMIRQACDQLNELVTQILDLAKLEAGMMKLKLAPADLCELAREVHGLFLAAAGQRRVELGLDLKAARAPVSVDLPLIRRVLQNLVSNALKFTPKGGSIVLEVEESAGEYHCAVRDTGPGIAAAQLGSLFKKFQQASGVEAEGAERGTGLGLALVKSTVEAHGGRAGAESEVGKGSRFYFVLPKA